MRSATAPLPSASSSPPASAAEASADPGFGVYIHWPFCLAKCPYCDFNSHVRARVEEARWRRALIAELDHFAARTAGRTVASIFFGGGTPSLMRPQTAAALIARVRERWPVARALEVTLEANPGAAEAERFAGFAAAGVNRLSLGVQALAGADLAALGRIHGRAEALAAIGRARRFFPRLSFDLIYARPGQTRAAWRAELDEAVSLAADHLSLYQLTIEPGTAFHTLARTGRLTLPSAAAQAALYEITQERLCAAGLPAYEVSNHARPGAECRHNLTYWRYGDYVGVGPGAHGRFREGRDKLATVQHRLPEAWLVAVERQGHGTRDCATLDAGERAAEMLLMGLRLGEGVARARFAAEVGAPLEAYVSPAALARLVDGGLVRADVRGIGTTPAGRLRLDAVVAALLS